MGWGGLHVCTNLRFESLVGTKVDRIAVLGVLQGLMSLVVCQDEKGFSVVPGLVIEPPVPGPTNHPPATVRRENDDLRRVY